MSKSSFSDIEWQTRIDLAACYRLVDHYRMSDMIYNHITAKIPGTQHFLINPFGLLYSQVHASCFYKIDLHGKIVYAPNSDLPLNLAGFAIHSALHEGRQDINCVLHAHTRAGMAVAAMKCGILPLSQPSTYFFENIGYHDFETPTKNNSERARLVRNLGSHEAMILRNHGLITVGRTIGDAFSVMYWLTQVCQVQVDCLSSSTELTFIEESVARETGSRYRNYKPKSLGQLAWPALISDLNKRDQSYIH